MSIEPVRVLIQRRVKFKQSNFVGKEVEKEGKGRGGEVEEK
jgi:hypothetical protein